MTIAEALEKRGEARGAKKRDIEIATKMIENGVDKASIAEFVDMDLAKIEALSDELSKEQSQELNKSH